MAHAEYTGKNSSALLGAAAITGWQEITITEKGKPAAAQLDTTTAGDAAYGYMTDPLGAEGTPSCEVQISGLLSVTNHKDNGLLSKAIDSTATLVVKKSTGGDWFTAANAILRSHETSVPFAGVVPFTARFALDTASGVWATGA